MKKIAGDINTFVSWFREQINVIDSVKFAKSEYNSPCKKALYVGIIDTLSKTVYPTKGNRDRFVSLIREFSDWKFGEKISLPHLIRLLEKLPDPEFTKLRQSAYSHIGKWKPGEFKGLDDDLNYNDVKKLWPKGDEYKKLFEKVTLDSLKHVHLFYSYRNALVHEERQLGYGMEISNENTPYYHQMTDMENQNFTWELVYPLNFIKSICETILSSLETYYKHQKINPYSVFTFGTYWIEELNS